MYYTFSAIKSMDPLHRQVTSATGQSCAAGYCDFTTQKYAFITRYDKGIRYDKHLRHITLAISYDFIWFQCGFMHQRLIKFFSWAADSFLSDLGGDFLISFWISCTSGWTSSKSPNLSAREEMPPSSHCKTSWGNFWIMGILAAPPQSYPPPRKKGLIFGLIKGKPMVNKPLIRPYFWGG